MKNPNIVIIKGVKSHLFLSVYLHYFIHFLFEVKIIW